MIKSERYMFYTIRLIVFSFLLILSYAFFYMRVIYLYPNSFHGLTKESNFIDFLYFSVVTFTTTGYGDIYPLDTIARFFVFTEIVMGISLVIAIICTITVVIVLRRNNL
ncbi:MAG: voltage-gated potassium channel [Pelotomaculum sp. PtaB.Bin104]|nr:MAG: voltage-gated potassium channel [Pelotomaculum sp. PtaB.Bin104]